MAKYYVTAGKRGQRTTGTHPRGAFPPYKVNKPLASANPPPNLPRHTQGGARFLVQIPAEAALHGPLPAPLLEPTASSGWKRGLVISGPTGPPVCPSHARRAGPGAQGRDLPLCLFAARRPNDAAIPDDPEHSCPSVASEPSTAPASVAHRWVAAGHGALDNVGFHAVTDVSNPPPHTR